jgi:leucyl-tRNA---protein transferase
MKYIFKEHTSDYQNYKFPYLIYAEAEKDDSVEDMYNKGFLPSRIKNNYYYMSRNLRIDLENFELSSENKRILKKTEGLIVKNEILKDFEFNYDISKLASEYFKERFGKLIISPQKLKWLFSSEFFTNILTYKMDNKVMGYCIAMESQNILHYAYPFYEPKYIGQNVGIGMILKAIELAKNSGKKYFYLGTAYAKEASYKLQFKGIEWFDGENWNSDINLLKEKVKNDI